jgi:hypothetical protein
MFIDRMPGVGSLCARAAYSVTGSLHHLLGLSRLPREAMRVFLCAHPQAEYAPHAAAAAAAAAIVPQVDTRSAPTAPDAAAMCAAVLQTVRQSVEETDRAQLRSGAVSRQVRGR